MSKYLPSYFNCDILFALHPLALGIPMAYGCLMDGTDTLDGDEHPRCNTKITNIQHNFGMSFQRYNCYMSSPTP